MPKKKDSQSTLEPTNEPTKSELVKDDRPGEEASVNEALTSEIPATEAPSEAGEETGRQGIRRRLSSSIGGLNRLRSKPKLMEPITPSRPVLVEFKEVVKNYERHIVLDHVSFKLYKGEFLSLVGPSGAGKSTLIKCLTLQQWPDDGRIIVAGRDITQLKPRELPYYRRKVGIVFQDFKLLPTKTVYENVSFALEVSNTSKKEIISRVEIMLETVGMSSKKDNFPHELSGGEQQRVAIARALVHDPKILIADEPTGNLDPVNTWEIIELLFKINKSGTMVILATHDREIVDALKKRVITMRAGKIVSDQEKGTYLV
jgi:cell division transport system ATP-binding protein